MTQLLVWHQLLLLVVVVWHKLLLLLLLLVWHTLLMLLLLLLMLRRRLRVEARPPRVEARPPPSVSVMSLRRLQAKSRVMLRPVRRDGRSICAMDRR
jgi:1,4-dihydroxy-2-naphthoate octaprenyltransferase